jgi:uncharacterized protein (DUF427 family)
MTKALWNGVVVAESDVTEILDENHYFPPDSIHRQYFRDSEHHTVCGWKGTASYYDVVVEENANANAAWYYPAPKDAVAKVRDYVAFWKGVQIQP